MTNWQLRLLPVEVEEAELETTQLLLDQEEEEEELVPGDLIPDMELLENNCSNLLSLVTSLVTFCLYDVGHKRS